MAKWVNDAGWGQFLQILSIKAQRAGLLTRAVNPNGTSQNCSGCGTKVLKQLKDTLHVCPECGLTLERDHNAAINIKHLAVGHSVNKAHLTSEAIAGVDEKPALYT
ncbi:MAG: transposase [Brasilonema angustatum HA4187-MV1]|nr:transposase [Brasilonema angustatum HA4187-MV1]